LREGSGGVGAKLKNPKITKVFVQPPSKRGCDKCKGRGKKASSGQRDGAARGSGAKANKKKKKKKKNGSCGA